MKTALDLRVEELLNKRDITSEERKERDRLIAQQIAIATAHARGDRE